jgi:hypothetical protein
MTEDEWTYNDGNGYQGKYCCPGCANGTGCECDTGETAKAKKAKTGEGRRVGSS